MKFVKNYLMILTACYVFGFFGGWTLFDFSVRYYGAAAAWAFVIAVIISVYMAQEERIEQLEKRIKELEEKGDSE